MNTLLNQSSQRPLNPSILAKLELLDNIQKGNYQRVRQLAFALSKVNNTNPQLYSKMTEFVTQHQQQLHDIDSNQNDDKNNQQPEIQNIDDNFVQGKQWDSDEEIQYDEEQEDEEKLKPVKNNQKKIMTEKPKLIQGQKKQLFKDLKNTMERRSVSNKKSSAPVNNTYQFKSPVVVASNKKPTQLKPSSSKPQMHKNSAIGRTRNPVNN